MPKLIAIHNCWQGYKLGSLVNVIDKGSQLHFIMPMAFFKQQIIRCCCNFNYSYSRIKAKQNKLYTFSDHYLAEPFSD